MCGIVGYVGLDAPITKERLSAMRDTMVHRGPDGDGIFVSTEENAAVGLGHRRLAIIDTREIGLQPLSNEDGTIHAIFNGEIYNFRELREELIAHGHVFRTLTDTEVLVHLYEDRGDNLLSYIYGMFAFAIWDAKNHRLFLARDRLGKKPLYYAWNNRGTLFFASEIKALLTSGCIDDTIDLQALHDYLALNYVPGPRSMLAAINKLPPAHALIWEDGKIRQFRYWNLNFHSVDPERRFKQQSMHESARETLKMLDGAVQRRLVSDVPIGMFLSGGVDSTAILMCMAENTSLPVKAFTIGFEETSYDESDYAKIAAQSFGAEHHIAIVRPDADTFLGSISEAFDEPYADSSAIPLWYLCRFAREYVTVALGGDGGDELYAGYLTHSAYRIANLYRHLPDVLRNRVIPALVSRLPVSHSKVSFDLRARQFVAAASQNPACAHYGYKEFLSEEARAELRAIPAPDIEPTVRLFEAAFRAHKFADTLDAVLYSDFQLYLPDDILVKTDRMSMIHSLEVRSPFLDHLLVEQAASLPAHYKLWGLRGKHILRKALKGFLPTRILRRRKAGFNVPMAQWLNGPLRSIVRDMLAQDMVTRIGIWSAPAVNRLMVEHEARRQDNSRSIWALLMFMLWNERFRHGKPI